MRLVLIGQADFGKAALEALVNAGQEVVGVLTPPDVPGEKPNPVKVFGLEQGLNLLQPKGLRGRRVYEWVKALKPDLLVLAFVNQFVPKEVIDLARFGGINYHPSLLPKYRGGTAINWAIINGERETGVTIHYIDEGVDTGDIILQRSVSIDPEDNVLTVYFDKLFPLGVKMIEEAVRLIETGQAQRRPQDESLASFQPVIKEEDTMINWADPADKIYNLVRGSVPRPGAGTFFQGQLIKIMEATGRPVQREGVPGEILGFEEDGFVVGTGSEGLLVRKGNVAGKKRGSALDLAREIGLMVGDRLGQ